MLYANVPPAAAGIAHSPEFIPIYTVAALFFGVPLALNPLYPKKVAVLNSVGVVATCCGTLLLATDKRRAYQEEK